MMARIALSLIMLTVFGSHVSIAQEDQVVVASTRNYPSVSARTLDFTNFNGHTIGIGSDPCGTPVSLLDSSGYVATWIFVHGNQIPPGEAVKRGRAVYQRVRACSSTEGPIRFVIWSWPSERNTNRLKDAQIKRNRTNVESFLLGSFISAIAEDGPVRFVGYSFGARIVAGALHLSSGGQLDGHCLGGTTIPVTPYRVALLAAAVESDGLQGCGRYRHGLDHVESLLLMNNSRDQALRFFWILTSEKPKALGAVGANSRPHHVALRQYDWADQIGKDHSLWQYLDRPFIIQQLAEAVGD